MGQYCFIQITWSSDHNNLQCSSVHRRRCEIWILLEWNISSFLLFLLRRWPYRSLMRFVVIVRPTSATMSAALFVSRQSLNQRFITLCLHTGISPFQTPWHNRTLPAILHKLKCISPYSAIGSFFIAITTIPRVMWLLWSRKLDCLMSLFDLLGNTANRVVYSRCYLLQDSYNGLVSVAVTKSAYVATARCNISGIAMSSFISLQCVSLDEACLQKKHSKYN